MISLLLKPLLGKYLGSVVRTGLAALGGYLVAKGYVNSDEASTLIDVADRQAQETLGTMLFGIAQAASLIEKRIR